ncbi:MAG: hypothetical protein A2499_00285 [Stygiobacter sp. RIFOXYC12_FULL_38_8]|nr:MAG: hypothetical protein A2X62_07180 [Stygiobacter sp. GWC2_38_9]OGV09133.1 MAG: hypothetical protein A2299_11975 [Stygiobacter sp. RIFOXYB2_FULL_37_11]OGV16360.1 MAG: hypothetical protein A2440_04880 [Stygiobacter sp. RIFOXYC2_FULL_38_25]OGV27584.1 MAG: hypothetical protein A2499_00285 [Stygiobacter sp. RIFOXYC12_FULL_38_8]OGV81548.1 MAG: hypothetical protein A2X65_14955 [Stygiobacter sp. GWF2_38_21]RJQ64749.1 MAG: hypothetical protein C4517_01670 [Stygiobacter sp.]
MTLVPIIYTSLLIFSSILLFVILFSYISFKAKSNLRKASELKVHVGNQNVQIRPVAIPVQHAPIIIKKGNPGLVRQNPVRGEYSHSRSANPVSIDDYRQNQTRNSITRPTRLTREDRIVIMNDTTKLHTAKTVPSQAEQRTYQRLPDLNLLNYYSDRTDSEFITLTA